MFRMCVSISKHWCVFWLRSLFNLISIFAYRNKQYWTWLIKVNCWSHWLDSQSMAGWKLIDSGSLCTHYDIINMSHVTCVLKIPPLYRFLIGRKQHRAPLKGPGEKAFTLEGTPEEELALKTFLTSQSSDLSAVRAATLYVATQSPCSLPK